MDDTTKTLFKSIAAGQVRTYAAIAAGSLATWGVVQPDQTTQVTSLIAAGITGVAVAAWSGLAKWWDETGKQLANDLLAAEVARLRGHIRAITPVPAGQPMPASTANAIASAKEAAVRPLPPEAQKT